MKSPERYILLIDIVILTDFLTGLSFDNAKHESIVTQPNCGTGTVRDGNSVLVTKTSANPIFNHTVL